MSDETPVYQERHGNAVAAWPDHRMVPDFRVITSLPQDLPEHRLAVLSIVDSECVAGGDLVGQTMTIAEYIVHIIELTEQETGEVSLARRTILIAPDHPPIAFVSEGVYKSLGKLGWAVGRMPPWDPPVRVRLVQRSGKGGRRFFKLVPVDEG